MKVACSIIIISLLISIALFIFMVKVASDITIEEHGKEVAYFGDLFRIGKRKFSYTPINNSFAYFADRYPYLVALIENTPKKPIFSCFGAMVSRSWLISSAHCYTESSTYRVLLLYDYANNHSSTHPIMFWKTNINYSSLLPNPTYDIALAKFEITTAKIYEKLRFASLNPAETTNFELCLWKTLQTDEGLTYLINDFDSFPLLAAAQNLCRKNFFNYTLDNLGVICINLERYDECLVTEFGPVFIGDKIVGILSLKPLECSNKLAVLTNVSYHYDWISKEINQTTVIL